MHFLYECQLCLQSYNRRLNNNSIVYKYSQTCLFWTPWGPKNCPDYIGVLISQVHLYTLIISQSDTTGSPELSSVILECQV